MLALPWRRAIDVPVPGEILCQILGDELLTTINFSKYLSGIKKKKKDNKTKALWMLHSVAYLLASRKYSGPVTKLQCEIVLCPNNHLLSATSVLNIDYLNAHRKTGSVSPSVWLTWRSNRKAEHSQRKENSWELQNRKTLKAFKSKYLQESL